MKTKTSIWSDYLVYVKMFYENTSLHGFKYLVNYKMSSKQRLIWTTAMVFTLVVTCMYLWRTVKYARSNMMTTNIDTMQQSNEEIEFPSVFVCSYNLVRRSRAEAIIKEWNLPSVIDKKKVFAEIKILPLNMFRGRSGLFAPSLLTSILTDGKISIDDLLQKLAVPCDELMVRCQWKNKVLDCAKMFRLVKSYDGYCCAFNYFADTNSTVDHNGIPYKSKTIASTSYRNGLAILIKTNKKDYYSTTFGNYGSKVLINRPWDYPDETSWLTVVKPNVLMMISYIPSTTITSGELLEIEKSDRNCINRDEERLNFFPIYTYQNCIVECKINETEKHCDCIPTVYPKRGSHKVCDLNDLQCLASHQAMISSLMIGMDRDHILKSVDSNHWNLPCNCKPLCFSTSYITDSTSSQLNFSYYYNAGSEFFCMKLCNCCCSQGVNFSQDLSLIYVFPQDLVSTRDRNDVYYSFTSLLASFGSFLSFFLGFNMVCVAEIIYYLILLPCLSLVIHIYKKISIIVQKL